MNYTIRRLILCLLLSILATPVSADPISDALKAGDVAAARAALETQIAGRNDAALHRAHLEGLIAMRQGDFLRAETIFTSILSKVPSYEPARLQLVKVHSQLGQTGKALRLARSLAASTKDKGLRDELISHIAQVESRRTAGMNLRFSLTPSSNLTGGTSATTVIVGGVPFNVDEASREAAGVSLTFGVSAFKTWKLADDWQAILSGSVDRRLFSVDLKADETEANLTLDLTRRGERGFWTIGPRYELLLQGSDVARRRIGVALKGEYLFSPRLRFTFSTEWVRQYYPDADYRDGTLASGAIGLQWAVSPKTRLSIDMPVQRESTAAPHLSHRDLGLGLGIEQTFDSGLTLGGTLFAGKNSYDGVYPGFSMERVDDVASMRLTFRHSAIGWNGLTPEFSVTRKRQASSIPLHDSWTTDFGIAVIRKF